MMCTYMVAHLQDELAAADEKNAMIQELQAQVDELHETLAEAERQALKHQGAAEAAQMQNKVHRTAALVLYNVY